MSEDCAGTPGKVVPVVDRNRCEAKEDCVRVCPYHVFEVQSLAPEDRAGLSWLGWLKAWAHGNRQAYVVRPGDCHACQRCIEACPEDAIHLVALRADDSSPQIGIHTSVSIASGATSAGSLQ